ncbi:unnamed protein product, partial [Porites lobata]
TAEGTIADNGIVLLKSLVEQLKQKRQTLKELNDKIAVLLETPEELEAEILDAEELDSLIVEKVCLTDNLIELAKRNLDQYVLSHSPGNISTPSSSPQKGQTNQQPIPSTSQTEQENQQSNSPPSTGTSGSDFQSNTAASAENPPITPPITRLHHRRAHILFDEGSQRSFITSDVATKLDLKPEMQETISLSTFGGNTSSVKRIDTATVFVETAQEENIPIRVIIVPTIAAPHYLHWCQCKGTTTLKGTVISTKR